MNETIIETERLLLRRFQESDLQDLYEYLSDEEVVRHEPYKAMSLEETKDNLAWRVSTDEMIADGAHRIYAECDPQNAGSWKLLERLGFKREAHLRQNVYFWKDEQGNPIWKDSYVYAMLNERGQAE